MLCSFRSPLGQRRSGPAKAAIIGALASSEHRTCKISEVGDPSITDLGDCRNYFARVEQWLFEAEADPAALRRLRQKSLGTLWRVLGGIPQLNPLSIG